MIITLAGCGALGSYVAARLIHAGLCVQVLQRPGQQFDVLRREGIRVENDDRLAGSAWHPERVVANASELAPADLLLVLVKSQHTDALVDEIGGSGTRDVVRSGGCALTLQNGLGNVEKLERCVPPVRLGAGSITYGAYRIAPGCVGFGGGGSIVFGPWQKGRRFDSAIDLLRAAELDVQWVDDPRPVLWRKLVLNLMINLPTALTGLRNGGPLDRPDLLQTMRALGGEALEAAARAGVVLNEATMWQLAQDTMRATADNRSSMLQDLTGGLETEIEAIAGPVIAAACTDQEFPLTRAMAALISARVSS